MEQALSKAEENRLQEFGGLMDDADVDVQDIIIPKLLLMQQMSVLVAEEKARSGEIRSSLDGKLVAEKGGEIEFIPFKMYKTWVVISDKGNEFIEQVPVTVANADRPREEQRTFVDDEGKEFKKSVLNYMAINYYCLLPQEIEEGIFMPYVISFRSTGYMAGKTLETHRARLKEFRKPLCFRTFKLTASPRENDKGKFFAYEVSESRNTEDSELSAVKHWKSIIDQGVKVDESEFVDKEKNVSPQEDEDQDGAY